MNYPPYPEYKDSGVQWVNNLPNGWKSAPIWTLFRRTKALGFPDHELLSVYRDHGVVPKSSRDDNFNKPSDDLSAYQLVKRGFLVVNKMKAWQGSISVSGHEGIVSPAYYVYAPTCDQNLRYMHFALRSSPMIASYASISSGVRPNQWDLDPQAFSRLQVPLPPLVEQSAIADFLDRETAKIDALIAKQEQLIATLREDRIATITHAVTKGLDPNAEMKDSGVEWLGEIPTGWSVRPFLRCVENRVDYRGATPKKVDDGVLLVTARNVRSGWIDYEGSQEFVSPTEYDDIMRRGMPAVDDLLLTMEAPLGNAGLVDRTDVALAQRIVKFRPDRSLVSPKYLLYSVLGQGFQFQLMSRATGSTALGLKASKLCELKVVVPDLRAQSAIAKYLDERWSAIEALIAKSERMIGVLREYRSALITDAVTGKIDVRGAA